MSTDRETDREHMSPGLHNRQRPGGRPLFINSRHDIVLSVYQLLAVAVIDAVILYSKCFVDLYEEKEKRDECAGRAAAAGYILCLIISRIDV